MGNTDSNTKSSLLKNFQYLIDTKSGKTTLLYFDYLNFLHYELQHKAWKWEIYKTHVNGGNGDAAVLFCAWKQIQEQIFKTLEKQIKGSSTTYSWSTDVLPLINIKEKELNFSPQDCNSIKIQVNTIDELNNPQFPAISGTSGTTCNGLKTSKDIHVPLRRRGLLVKFIHDYLDGIKDDFENITDQSQIEAVLKRKNITIDSNKKNFDLTKDLVEGIGKEISNLIKQKHSKDDTAFCKEWERTMDDYFKLLQGIDIVDDKETNELQCLIKYIENKVGKDNFQDGWRKYFRDLAEQLRTKHFINPKTGQMCHMDQSTKTQCVRFFEEWAEEFCKLKKVLGNMVVTECGGKSGSGSGKTQSADCTNLCNIYKKFMTETKPYFQKYITTCTNQKYSGDSTTTEKDLQDMFTKAANNSTTECCKDNGDCTQDQLFDVTNDISNIRYKCFCPEGEYKKKTENDTQGNCSKIKDPSGMVQGQSIAPREPLSTASHSVSSGGTTPNCDDNTKCGYKEFIDDAEYDKIKGQQNCCGLKSDVKENKIKWRNTDDEYYKYLKDPPFNKDPVPEQVYLPPRKKNLCFRGIDGQNNDVNNENKLREHLLEVGATEGYNLGEYYKKKKENPNDDKYNYDVLPCNALKYSFLDLRSIILGFDMTEPKTYGTEKNLNKIFQGGKPSGGGTQGSEKRRNFWTQNKECVWKAMQCGYKHSGATDTLTGCDKMPDDTTYPVGTTRDDGKNFQFLRWIEEWSEDFCNKRKKLADKVVSACKECKDASDEYHKKSNVDYKSGGSTGTSGASGKDCNDKNSTDTDCKECKQKCDACKEACKNYKNFVQNTDGKNDWRKQWKDMEKKYRDLMEKAKEKLKTELEEQQQKKTPSASDSIPPFMTQCQNSGNSVNSGSNSGNSGDNLCVKPDVESFYQYLYDKGYSTLSSYINNMSHDTDCGNDKHVVATNTCGITYI